MGTANSCTLGSILNNYFYISVFLDHLSLGMSTHRLCLFLLDLFQVNCYFSNYYCHRCKALVHVWCADIKFNININQIILTF